MSRASQSPETPKPGERTDEEIKEMLREPAKKAREEAIKKSGIKTVVNPDAKPTGTGPVNPDGSGGQSVDR